MTDDGGDSGRTKNGQFKPGTCGNRKGRPKKKPPAHAEIIRNALDASIEYHDGHRVVTTTRRELGLRLLRDRAVKGIIAAADQLLKIRNQAEREGDIGAVDLVISDWLPDSPTQTADDKNCEFAETGNAKPMEWWNESEQLTPSPETGPDDNISGEF